MHTSHASLNRTARVMCVLYAHYNGFWYSEAQENCLIDWLGGKRSGGFSKRNNKNIFVEIVHYGQNQFESEGLWSQMQSLSHSAGFILIRRVCCLTGVTFSNELCNIFAHGGSEILFGSFQQSFPKPSMAGWDIRINTVSKKSVGTTAFHFGSVFMAWLMNKWWRYYWGSMLFCFASLSNFRYCESVDWKNWEISTGSTGALKGHLFLSGGLVQNRNWSDHRANLLLASFIFFNQSNDAWSVTSVKRRRTPLYKNFHLFHFFTIYLFDPMILNRLTNVLRLAKAYIWFEYIPHKWVSVYIILTILIKDIFH